MEIPLFLLPVVRSLNPNSDINQKTPFKPYNKAIKELSCFFNNKEGVGIEKEPMVSKGNKRLAIYSLRPFSRPLKKAISKSTKHPAVSNSRVLSGPLKKAKYILKALIT